jgi:Fe-S-cluster containining protein
MQVDKVESNARLVQRPVRSPHYAASPELRALYADACQSCGMCCIYFAVRPFGMPIAAQGNQPPKRFIQIGKRIRQYTRDEGIKLQSGRTSIGTDVQFGAESTTYLRVKPDATWKNYNRCAALAGIQGVKVECSTYESRPLACSDYDPGSPNCLKVRRWAGLEPIDDGYGRS